MTTDQLQQAARHALTAHRPSAWAIRPEALRAIEAVARGSLTPAVAADAAAQQQALRRGRELTIRGGVAVISLTGVIMPQASFLSLLFGGGGGLLGFREQFRDALADPDVSAIVLEIDSPGGIVDLVPETAAEIRAARGTKPIVAVANTMAASAAYWIGCQADELVVTTSGEVGSIGVYITHVDWSGMDEQMGVTYTLISAGKYKTEGNPYEPLSDDARAALQQDVDDTYGAFVADVAAGRGASTQDVIDGYGEGRCVLATRAVTAGLADRVARIDDVIAELSGAPSTSRRRGLAERLAPVPTASAEPAPPVVEPTPPAADSDELLPVADAEQAREQRMALLDALA